MHTDIQSKLKSLPKEVRGRYVKFIDAITKQVLGSSFENYILEQERHFTDTLWTQYGVSIDTLTDQGLKDIRAAIGVFRSRFGEDASWSRVQGYICDKRVY